MINHYDFDIVILGRFRQPRDNKGGCEQNPEEARVTTNSNYIATLDSVSGIRHWWKDVKAAHLLPGTVRNDHV